MPAAQLRYAGGIGAECGQLLQQCRRGVAAGIETHRDRHQLLHNWFVRRYGKHRGDVGGQAARRGKGGDLGRSSCQPFFLQCGKEGMGKGFAEFFQRLGRQFFNEEFNEEILSHGIFRKA